MTKDWEISTQIWKWHQQHIGRSDSQEVVRHLEKLGEVGEEGWPVPEEAWTRLGLVQELFIIRSLKSFPIYLDSFLPPDWVRASSWLTCEFFWHFHFLLFLLLSLFNLFLFGIFLSGSFWEKATDSNLGITGTFGHEEIVFFVQHICKFVRFFRINLIWDKSCQHAHWCPATGQEKIEQARLQTNVNSPSKAGELSSWLGLEDG